jgi:hypothetical protein
MTMNSRWRLAGAAAALTALSALGVLAVGMMSAIPMMMAH